MGDQDLAEAIAGALMSVWKIRRFSESRWLTIGSSCRILIAGLATGLDDLVCFIQQDSFLDIIFLIPSHPLPVDKPMEKHILHSCMEQAQQRCRGGSVRGLGLGFFFFAPHSGQDSLQILFEWFQ